MERCKIAWVPKRSGDNLSEQGVKTVQGMIFEIERGSESMEAILSTLNRETRWAAGKYIAITSEGRTG
jgi:hypothetical protein